MSEIKIQQCYRKPELQNYVKWDGTNFEEIQKFFEGSNTDVVFGHSSGAVYHCLNELSNSNFVIYIIDKGEEQMVLVGNYIVANEYPTLVRPKYECMSEEEFKENFITTNKENQNG
jgi:hypothetical protein